MPCGREKQPSLASGNASNEDLKGDDKYSPVSTLAKAMLNENDSKSAKQGRNKGSENVRLLFKIKSPFRDTAHLEELLLVYF